MNVLSLFDGISCGRIALERLGMKVDKYFACEIDKFAIQVSQDNYPDIIQLGDVCDVKGSNLPEITLLIGGSPCQGFSFAGNQLAFDDPRSVLFFEYVRLLKECKPKYFLLENVRMKQEFEDVISEYVGYAPHIINSSLLSAQNRTRLYWTNIPNIKQPKDKGVVLSDILEHDGIADIDAQNGAEIKNSVARRQETMVPVEPIPKPSNNGLIRFGEVADTKYDLAGRVYHQSGKGPTIHTCQGGNREPKVAVKMLTERRTEEAKELVPRTEQKSNPLITNASKDQLCIISKEAEEINWKEYTWRPLTPIEVERLQTVPDNYTSCVSKTQRFKQLGNGWTVDVICHILKNTVNEPTPQKPNFQKQLDIFQTETD